MGAMVCTQNYICYVARATVWSGLERWDYMIQFKLTTGFTHKKTRKLFTVLHNYLLDRRRLLFN